MAEDIGDKDRVLIDKLRADNADLLTAKYATDFNLLRWLIGHEYDYEQASHHLRRHLKVSISWRKHLAKYSSVNCTTWTISTSAHSTMAR
jgi:hypothetical protein